jgi:TonB-dependent starch-binding outer membrane protein SusC
MSLLFTVILYSQERTITGTVIDKTGLTVPGVNVIIKNTTIGVITDIEGKFSLKVPDNNTVLVISYIGYITQEIQVGEQTNIKIELKEDVKQLDEVVVVGYGVQKRSDLTGAIASVSGKTLERIPIAGIDQAIQGKAAGVNIIPKSGRPGAGVDISIRGISSINGSSPLVVIDGINVGTSDEGAMTKLNPNDIESIDVLKDASSSAIYGASGGNGVILISTKAGKEGKLVTNFNMYGGIETVARKIPLMNSQQWFEVYEETNINRDSTRKSVPKTYRPDTLKTYDWQDIMFKPATTKNYSLSLSGGNDLSKYFLSFSYNDQKGIIKNSSNGRLTIRINSDHKITKHITIDEKINFSNIVNHGFTDEDWQGYYYNPVKNGLNMVPYLPEYNPNYNQTWGDSLRWTNGEGKGEFGTAPNPMSKIDVKNRKHTTNDFEGNFGISLNLIKGLTYTSRFYTRLGFMDEKDYKKIFYNCNVATFFATTNALNQEMRRDINWNFQNILSYNTNFLENNNITLMAGSESAKKYWFNMTGVRNQMPSDQENMLYLENSTDAEKTEQFVSGKADEARYYRYFGRLNYDYKNKYLLTINVSQDYSSDFSSENRGATFPSFSLGWKFSEEEFMKNQNLISFGKFRAGYGEAGANAKQSFPWASLVLTPLTYRYSFDNRNSQIGGGPVQVPNPDLKWESVSTTNFGLDLGLFRNALLFTAEYFQKLNDGMIMSKSLPATAGTASMGRAYDGAETSPLINFGKIRNRGVEFSMEMKKKEGDLTGSFVVNFSIVRNKIMSLVTDSAKEGSVHTLSPIALTRVGSSISEYWGFKTNGLFRETDPMVYNKKAKRMVFANQTYSINNTSGDTTYMQPNAQAGDFRFVDMNNDGIMDQRDKIPLGSPLPKFTFGFSINLEYKIFDLVADFYGSYGNKVFNGTKQYLYYYQENYNRCADFANRYKDEIVKNGLVVVNENHNTDIPRNKSANYNTVSDFYIEDASYLRLQNFQIGVSVPKSLLNKIKVERIRLYVGVKNLFTLTGYSGFTPDISTGNNQVTAQGIDYGSYPPTRMYFAGVNIQF